MDKGIAIYRFEAGGENELKVDKNDILEVIEKHDSWWKVKNVGGKIGLVPVEFIAYPVTGDMKVVSRGKTNESHDATTNEEVTIDKGVQVAIFDNTDDYWSYVGFLGKAGYIPKHQINLFPNKKKKEKEKGHDREEIPEEPTEESFEVVPNKAQTNENTTILISFKEKLPEQGTFIVVFKGKHCEKTVDAEKINNFTLSVNTPKYHPAENTKLNVNCLKNGGKPETIGKNVDFKFESRIDIVHRLLKAESDPIAFLCSSFQVENIQNVDYILSGFIEKKSPEGFNVLKGGQSTIVQQQDNPKEIPTLLHFAAFYNLSKLAKTLLKCPGAEEASRVLNCHGNVPHALADLREHGELAEILRDNASAEDDGQNQEIYQEMENLYEKYVKMDSDESDYVVARTPALSTSSDIYEDMAGRNPSEPEEHYDTPRPEGEEDALYDEINENVADKRQQEREKQKQFDEYKVYGRMTEKEVQLALLMKRVKERYITQEQALDMARVLRLEPKINTPAVAKKSGKVKKKTSAPMMSELTKKVKSLPRTASTSSGSSMSSVGSNASVASSGYTSEDVERAKFPVKPLPKLPSGPPKPVPRSRKSDVSRRKSNGNRD